MKYGSRGTIGPAHRFTWNEVACNDGTPLPQHMRKACVRHAKALNKLRKHVAKFYRVHHKDVIISVNSWYRSPEYNARVGGASQSKHLDGIATDIILSRKGLLVPPMITRHLAARVREFRNGGIGAYAMFTHVDSRKDGAARWSG